MFSSASIYELLSLMVIIGWPYILPALLASQAWLWFGVKRKEPWSSTLLAVIAMGALLIIVGSIIYYLATNHLAKTHVSNGLLHTIGLATILHSLTFVFFSQSRNRAFFYSSNIAKFVMQIQPIAWLLLTAGIDIFHKSN